MVRITINGSDNSAIFNQKSPNFLLSIYRRIRKFPAQRGYGYFPGRYIFGCIQRGQGKDKTSFEEEKLIPSICPSMLSDKTVLNLLEKVERNPPSKPLRGIIRK